MSKYKAIFQLDIFCNIKCVLTFNVFKNPTQIIVHEYVSTKRSRYIFNETLTTMQLLYALNNKEYFEKNEILIITSYYISLYFYLRQVLFIKGRPFCILKICGILYSMLEKQVHARLTPIKIFIHVTVQTP